jgi:hypothetical protein
MVEQLPHLNIAKFGYVQVVVSTVYVLVMGAEDTRNM